MTVIRGEAANVQTEQSQLSRTFAMTVFGVGNWVLSATMIYFVLGLALPLAGDPEAPPIPPFIASIAIFALIGVLSMYWSGARRRFWAAP